VEELPIFAVPGAGMRISFRRKVVLFQGSREEGSDYEESRYRDVQVDIATLAPGLASL
jgi:hypothetical protein